MSVSDLLWVAGILLIAYCSIRAIDILLVLNKLENKIKKEK